MNKDKEEKEEEWALYKKAFLESDERVLTGLYKLLRSFSADLEHPRNSLAVGQAISSLYNYVKKNDLFSNVRAEDLDDWFREELNFQRELMEREHEEEEKKLKKSTNAKPSYRRRSA
jgi:hypothetical protein